MQRLSLDYQKSGAAATRIGAILFLAGVLTALSITMAFRSTRLDLATAEANMGHLTHQAERHKGLSSSARSSPELQHEAQLANDILMQLALPWESMFNTLESSNTDQIALLAIQPDTGKHSIKVNGEAKDFSALLNYIQQLEQDKTMSDVALLNHEINQQAPEKPVRFALTANWRLAP